MDPPEFPKSQRNPECDGTVASLERPAHCRPEVIVFRPEAVQPEPLIGTLQPFLRGLGVRDEKLLEGALNELCFATRSQLFSGKLADGFQHHVARFASRG